MRMQISYYRDQQLQYHAYPIVLSPLSERVSASLSRSRAVLKENAKILCKNLDPPGSKRCIQIPIASTWFPSLDLGDIHA